MFVGIVDIVGGVGWLKAVYIVEGLIFMLVFKMKISVVLVTRIFK